MGALGCTNCCFRVGARTLHRACSKKVYAWKEGSPSTSAPEKPTGGRKGGRGREGGGRAGGEGEEQEEEEVEDERRNDEEAGEEESACHFESYHTLSATSYRFTASKRRADSTHTIQSLLPTSYPFYSACRTRCVVCCVYGARRYAILYVSALLRNCCETSLSR